jgi:2-phospho-L-lactate/phosphoenolpyruvate guanylyltransferase
MTQTFIAIVPVKRFSVAKTRLASLLDAPQRAELAAAMLRDVLDVLDHSELGDIVVITSDPLAQQIAYSHGASVVEDRSPDLNSAVTAALDILPQTSGVLVVPSDIPAVTSREIIEAVAGARRHGVALARAARDGGTNLLAWRFDIAMGPTFGSNSLAAHAALARRAGVEPEILDLAGASLDIDCPEDFAAMTGKACGPRTTAFLRKHHAKLLQAELSGAS